MGNYGYSPEIKKIGISQFRKYVIVNLPDPTIFNAIIYSIKYKSEKNMSCFGLAYSAEVHHATDSYIERIR